MNWDLSALYKGFDDPYYQKDIQKLKILVEEFNSLPNKFNNEDELEVVLNYVDITEKLNIVVKTLYSFNSLISATDVSNQQARINISEISNLLNNMTKAEVLFNRYIEKIDLNKYLNNKIVSNNLFHLQQLQNSAKYLLSENEELLYSKLSEVSSRSWKLVHSLLTAKLGVEFNDETITLSEVRNLAYDNSQEIRKNAYNSEIKAYESIEEMVALALSNIKQEVVIMNNFRGYKDVFEPTLIDSNMSRETLDAMMSAIVDSKPYFEKYLLAKAKHLGHNNGLPFYDLFAPVGDLVKTFTYDEAKEIIVESFSSYSKDLSNFAQLTFDNNWIDPFPKKGKVGGAFCSNQPQIGESRILSNFTGSLSDVSTLAHELGHGYHGHIIKDNSPLNWSYPMPLAETASIFCETIVSKHLLSELTNNKEKLSVLEISLQGDTQVIIDILSRFIFEKSIFDLAHGPINSKQMKDLMIKAQKEAYGKGLDENYLHPYMWLNKGHYYSAGLSFYNFPYAFGLLFGKGLYAQYLKNPNEFIKNYDNLLALTTKASVEDVALSMNIDVTKKEFWENSLNIIKEDIEEVIKLLNE